MKVTRIISAALAGMVLVSSAALAECPCKAGAKADPPFPAWVFGHVVWLDESTTQSVYDLAQGYMERGVPVDGVIIDSPWETAYNTLEFDPERYPNAQELIDDLHRNDIRVILWITSVINLEDPEYRTALASGWFVKGMEDIGWWKGSGGWLDYDDPEAVEWWHQRMDKAIDMGLDGWKCDGTDPYTIIRGPKRRRRYTDDYYSDFYYYTRERSGRKTLVMARPKEQILNENVLNLPAKANPLGLGLYFRYAPQEVSYMSWVGDQDPTFDGLKIAVRWILDSAKKDYLIIGSDIGGYRDGGPDKEVLIRWAQFGAFCPFMENGGCGEHRPWMHDEETLNIYRTYVLLHKALGPYLYSEAVEAWQEGRSMITPLKGGKDHYLLGKDILVAPVEEAGGKVRVVLPRGDDWMPLFASPEYLADTEKCRTQGSGRRLLKGGCSFTHTYGLDRYPAFARAGALIPLDVSAGPGLFKGLSGPGGRSPEDHPRAVMMVPPAPGEKVAARRTVHQEGRYPVVIEGSIETGPEGGISSTVSGPDDWPTFYGSPFFPETPVDAEVIDWR
jgi:alpha-glucosidase (family GH31 glycosyl hydrolase)